jgi:hypothetical protein
VNGGAGDRDRRDPPAPEPELRDGSYDAFIVWAESRGAGTALECTITAGQRRGTVVSIVSNVFAVRDPIDLVGLPCTLVVRGGEIRVEP